MKLGRVLGSVVSTVKHPTYVGKKLLCVQPTDAWGADEGEALLAVDAVQAGVGDRVLVMSEGSGARQVLGGEQNQTPIRSVIVAIVDDVQVAV